MNLPLSFCKLLIEVLHGLAVSEGRFSSKQNRKLLDEFVSEGILSFNPRRNTKYVLSYNHQQLRDYLARNFQITHLEGYIEFLKNSDATRSEGVKVASNSKAKNNRVLQGFFVKTYLDINGVLNGEPLCLKPPNGTWLYIVDFNEFTIPEDVTVVGVENTETFGCINNYSHLFTDKKPLFLLRFDNNSYIEWLKLIRNPYLHFGDFDLSSLAIYIREFREKLGVDRCDFFVPDNIFDLITTSDNRSDYLNQLDDPKVKNLVFDDYPEIKELANHISSKKKTVEQEILMKAR